MSKINLFLTRSGIVVAVLCGGALGIGALMFIGEHLELFQAGKMLGVAVAITVTAAFIGIPVLMILGAVGKLDSLFVRSSSGNGRQMVPEAMDAKTLRGVRIAALSGLAACFVLGLGAQYLHLNFEAFKSGAPFAVIAFVGILTIPATVVLTVVTLWSIFQKAQIPEIAG